MDNLGALPIDDFSGGMTDFTIGGDIRQNEIIKNMVIDENKDLITRPGSRPKFEYRITTNEVPQVIIPYSTEFLVQAESSLYFMDSGSATAINVTGGSDAFTGATSSSKIRFSRWNDNVVLTSSDMIYPLRAWKNQSSTYKLERLGMPHILLTYAITLANDIKAKYNAHAVDTGEHSSAETSLITSPDATDLDTLLTLASELLTDYELHLDNSGIHPGATSNRLEQRDFTTIYGAATALTDLKAKFNAHDADGTAHTSGGSSHQVTAKSTATELISSAGGSGSSYLYALHYKYTYQTLDKTFIENSDILFLEVSNVGTPNAQNITITLPNLSSMSEYDVSNISVAVYRTFDGGQDFFKLDEVPANTATYVDSKTDLAIENNAPIYSAGGILADEPPPRSKFNVIVNDTLVLGHIKDGNLELPNFIQFSKPNRLYSCPSQFRLEFDEDVKGLGYINTYTIVFCESKIYRVEGGFSSTGEGFVRKRLISDTVGTLSHESIVNTKSGVFFASEDGFYFTDGFQYKKISTDINKTFKALASVTDIKGTYSKLNNRVLWSAKRDSSNTYNDTIYVAHLDYPTIKDGFAFSFFDGGEDGSNFSVSGIGFDNEAGNNNLLRLYPNGYFIYHDDILNDDSFVSVDKTPDLWDTQTIFYNIDTVNFDFNDPKVRKWVAKMNVNAANVSALSLQISSSNDNTDQFSNLKSVIDQSNISWGDPTVVWGSDSILWNLLPIISKWRYFPATLQSIRCMYKQLRFKNAYIIIDTSDAIGNVSIVASTTTVTLLSHPTNTWVSDSVNYFISFAHESYAYEYKITAISGAALTITDSANTLTDSSDTAWLIKGYKKGEILNLSNYVVSYAPITMSQETSQGDSI